MDSVERLNILLQSFDECRISSFDGWRLIIIGDWDLSYHHNFEVEFEGVSYVQCPVNFVAQSFRLVTSQERQQLDSQMNLADYTEAEDSIYCFESDGRCFFIIIAQNLSAREELILHYEKE